MKSAVRHAVTATTAVSALISGCVTATAAHADTAVPTTGRTTVTKGTESTSSARLLTDGDTFTSTASNATNGAGIDLRAGTFAGGTKISYLHFSIPAGDVGHITSASLVLTRTAHHLPATTISARQVSGAWSEGALTAANAPALGATLDTESVSADTNTVNLDVTAAVRDQSAASFAITSPVTTDVAMFNSRESGASAAPALALTIAAPAAPVATSPTCAVSAELVSSCRVWLGDAPQAYGTTRVPTQAGRLAIDEAFTGRKFDILHQYRTNGQLFPDSSTIDLADQGRKLLINWKPATDMTWAKVAGGGADSRIDAEAAYLKAHFNRPFMLTIYHEPEDNVNLTAGSGMTPADYVAMYRHVVQRLHAQGATMFTTVMNYMGYYRWDSMRDTLYPGDDVVDWIAWDPYMHYPSDKAGGDFATLVNTAHGTSPGFYTWATTRHPGKPLMLAEWGVYNDHISANPMGPSQFYASVSRQLPQFPALKALVYFTMNPVDVPAGGATSPTVTAAGLAAWRTLALSPMLNTSAPVIAGRYQSSRIGAR